jgi:hypothetical protein
MVHNYGVLGIPPYDFEKTLQQSGFHDKSFIFVILNHYPDLTQLYSQSTNTLFLQWCDRQNVQLDDDHLTFDSIFTDSSRHRNHDRLPSADRQSHTSRQPAHPHPQLQRQSTQTQQEQEPRRAQRHQSQQPQAPHRHQTREAPHRETINPSDYASHIISSLLTPFLNGGHLDITIDDDTDATNLNTSELLNMFRGMQGFFDFDNVPVTLNEDLFNSLPQKKYSEVIENYKSTHQDEQPYTICPITREQFDTDSLVVVLECGHYFSLDGIRTWLLEHSTKCPCCNKDVRESFDDQDDQDDQDDTTQ